MKIAGKMAIEKSRPVKRKGKVFAFSVGKPLLCRKKSNKIDGLLLEISREMLSKNRFLFDNCKKIRKNRKFFYFLFIQKGRKINGGKPKSFPRGKSFAPY